jgi:Asp-tRNA(Asn)/Glu-tRNA(Gln) amidotransferase A subunit family amidase
VGDLELIGNIFALEREKNKLEPITLSAISVALIETPFFDQAGNGTRAAMSQASEILKEAGVKSVDKVELPLENDNAETLNRIHKAVFGYEAKNAFLADVRHDKQHELDPKIRKFVEDPKCSNVETTEALEAYEHIQTDFDKFARKYYAFITPSAVDIASEGLDDMGTSIFNLLSTVSTAEPLLLLLFLLLLPLDDLLVLLLLLLLSTFFLTKFPLHSNTSFLSAVNSYHSQMCLGLY